MNFIPFILRRASRNWRLLLVLATGVILATGLLASAPILVDSVIQLGLPRRLKAADPLDANLRLTAFANLGEEDYRDLNEPIQAIMQTAFAGHIKEIVPSIGSNWMFPWMEGTLRTDQRVNFRLFGGIESHVEFVSGGWLDPEGSATPASPEIYPVVIGEEMAAWYGLTTGDQLPLSFQTGADGPDIFLQITGVVQAKVPSDPYWLGALSPLVSQGNKRYLEQFSTFMPAEAFFAANLGLFPKSRSEMAWHVILDADTITAGDIPAMLNAISELPEALGNTVAVETGLDELLLDFYTQSQGIRTPVFLLTGEVVLLALVYVVMTAGLAVRAIEREFATLRSRGASRGQIFRIQLVEAALLVLTAIVAGPVIGAGLVRLLGWLGPLTDLGETAPLVTTARAAWTAALVGGAASLAGLLIPVGPALRRSIVTQTQTVGREAQPLWQRLYLDVALLVLGLILFARLQFYGGLSTGRVDWLLLLSPIAILLGTATLVVRITPPILRIIARLVATGTGLPGPLALWQTARNPGQFTGLVVLLTLANALGVLATGLNATMDASEIERAYYAAGSDVRLESDDAISAADFLTVDGITNAATGWRGSGTVNLATYRSFPMFDLLAMDPASFARVTYYRDDFSDAPMGELLGRLVMGDQLPGIELAGHPGELGLWVWADPDNPDAPGPQLDGTNDRDRLGYFAKILTHTGESILIPLTTAEPASPGAVTPEGSSAPDEPPLLPWVHYSAPLPEFTPEDYPLSLHSLWFRNRTRIEGQFTSGVRLDIAIDTITVVDRETGETARVEGFDDPAGFVLHEMRGTTGAEGLFVFNGDDAHEGLARGRLRLDYDRILADAGVVFNIADRDSAVIPALVSPRFIAATDGEVGGRVDAFVGDTAVTFEIVGIVNYFPTLYEREAGGFMITSSEGLLTRLGNETSRPISFNQVFLDTEVDADAATLAAASPNLVSRIWDAQAIRQLIRADPMALGLRSVTFLGYVLTSVLSLVGFATTFFLSVRQRAHSFGILRAMGMSPRQLYISLAVEQGLMIFTGLALGALLGSVLNSYVLPGLPVTLGDQYIPPFIPRSDWRAVLQVFLTLALAFAATFGLATWTLWRSKLHEALRYE